eukprot:GEMP01026862.1.p1 GENE.GEMP01026862.1~~GEMP01026862.1.p1  ORF type:complete len:351 (-),score=76.81 GEMP01026862.1:1127-2179(-)
MPRGSGKRAAEKSSDMPATKAERTKYITLLAENAPTKLQKHIITIAPHLAGFTLIIEFQIFPLLLQIYSLILQYIERAKPYYYKYNLHELGTGFAGLIMCFFGGEFPLIIVAVESFVSTSYKPVMNSLLDLYDQYQKAMDAHKKDDAVDEDEDGVPDVQQITETEYVRRKGLVLVKALDPEKCTKALGTINAAFVMILGALKMTFVRALALGKAVGDVMRKSAHKYVTPKLEEAASADLRKWMPTVVDWTCTIVSISIAFTLQRIISAVHSALRGGMLFTRSLLAYLDRHGYYAFKESESSLNEILGYSLAAIGFLFQFQSGFSLFFPLSILLFPFTMVEWFLAGMISLA